MHSEQIELGGFVALAEMLAAIDRLVLDELGAKVPRRAKLAARPTARTRCSPSTRRRGSRSCAATWITPAETDGRRTVLCYRRTRSEGRERGCAKVRPQQTEGGGRARKAARESERERERERVRRGPRRRTSPESPESFPAASARGIANEPRKNADLVGGSSSPSLSVADETAARDFVRLVMTERLGSESAVRAARRASAALDAAARAFGAPDGGTLLGSLGAMSREGFGDAQGLMTSMGMGD